MSRPARKSRQNTVSVSAEPIVSTPSLSLFGRKDTEVSIVNRYTVEQSTATSFNDGDTFIFDVLPDNTSFIDPHVYAKINFKIVKEDNTDIAADAQVALAPNSFSSLFSDVTVTANHVVLNSNDGLYPYSAYANNLLLTSRDEQTLLDASECLNVDTAAKFQMSAGALNLGFEERRKRTEKSQECSLYGRLQHPLFMQDKLLLPNLHLKIQLFQNANSFRLHHDSAFKFKLKIVDCKLVYTKVVVHELHLLNLMRALQDEVASYPLRRTNVRSYEIARGLQTFHGRIETSARLPSFVIAMLVDSNNFGTTDKNAFESDFTNLSKMCLNIEGVSIPSQPFSDSAEDRVRMYATLMNEVQRIRGHYPSITFDQFLKGFGFAIFPLDTGTAKHKSLPKSGTLSAQIRFSKPLDNPKTLICIAYSDATMFVDSASNVIIDYVP